MVNLVARHRSLVWILLAACADAPVETSASATGSSTTGTSEVGTSTTSPTTSGTASSGTSSSSDATTSSSSDATTSTTDSTASTATSSTDSTASSTTTGDTTTDDTTTDTGVVQICAPGEVQPCYEGPVDTEDVGPCHAGVRTCQPDGAAFGPCIGQVTPVGELCDNTVDDDCDGTVNQAEAGCVCVPGDQASCYEGPMDTLDQGVCVAGTRTCAPDGLGFGGCEGQVLPALETCDTPVDDDCDGAVNEEGVGCACVPDSVSGCYGGPPDTQDVGACHGGTQICNAQGTAFGPCTGEVLPTLETCDTPVDDDCDGETNEEGAGCVCVPNSVSACYSGAPATLGIGACKAGSWTCNAQGTAFGPCIGEIIPIQESCLTMVDDDCDGMANEGCPVVTYAGNVQPIFQAKCSPCHTANSSGGLNVNNYATTQLASGICGGQTKGGCTIVRIQNGTMPQGKGCTGNPILDAGNAACLTAAEQATIQAWIAGGQLP